MINNLFENVVNDVLIKEWTDGATNYDSYITFVDDDPKKGFYVYHACHADSVNSIMTAGPRRIFVASNICCSYGEGLYATYTLKSAKVNATRRDSRKNDGLLYGGYIARGICKRPLTQFVIFDPNIAKTVYGTELGIDEQLKCIFNGHMDMYNAISSHSYYSYVTSNFKMGHSSQGAAHLWYIINDLDGKGMYTRRFIKGVIFSGGNDGNVFVGYDMNCVEMVGYSKDNGNTFINIDRNEWEHKQHANNFDLQNELGNLYDVYPTQGFTDGFAVVGRRVNGQMKYRILAQPKLEYEKRHNKTVADGRISSIWFDGVYGLTFAVDDTMKVSYDGTLYIIKKFPHGKYKVYDNDEGVYCCELNDLPTYHEESKNPRSLQQSQDDTDWDNIDLSNF